VSSPRAHSISSFVRRPFSLKAQLSIMINWSNFKIKTITCSRHFLRLIKHDNCRCLSLEPLKERSLYATASTNSKKPYCSYEFGVDNRMKESNQSCYIKSQRKFSIQCGKYFSYVVLKHLYLWKHNLLCHLTYFLELLELNATLLTGPSDCAKKKV
jgi:hypothetical protein